MKDQVFYDFCQSLYENWLQGGNQLNAFEHDFKIDHLPEPYFQFPYGKNRQGKKCLYVLNYNPGHGLPIQERESVNTNFAGMEYYAVSDRMGEYYKSEIFAEGRREKPAARRFEKIMDFAAKGGFDSIMCVETFFLHSQNFDKKRFLRLYETNELVVAYNEKLKAFLSDKAVLVIASIGGNRTIDKAAVMANPWLAYQLQILGTNLKQATEIVIKQSRKGLTSAALFVEGKKYLSYMMGSNSLPRLTEDNYCDIFRKKKK